MTTERPHGEHHVSFLQFFAAMGLQLAALLGAFALVFSHAFRAEVSQPWSVLLWAAALGLPLSLFEYLYHRYLLHSAVFPFMAVMHRSHTKHHGLTSVKAPVDPREPVRLVEVTSQFPIEEPHQEESMMFPLYSLPIFAFVFLVLLALPLKLMLPAQPVVTSLLFAVAGYLVAYEVWHAILHRSFDDFWKPRMARRGTGWMFRRAYGFHLMHHWRPGSNQAIVGFWGVALWDYAFRTHRRPERMPLNGASVAYADAALPRPLWPISALDRWQSGLYQASRTFERFLARTFLRRRA